MLSLSLYGYMGAADDLTCETRAGHGAGAARRGCTSAAGLGQVRVCRARGRARAGAAGARGRG